MNGQSSPSATLPFSQLQDDEVSVLLKKHRIGLTVDEARKIGTFLKRDPTLVEATIWGIQGSEHSSYKSSRRFLKNFPTTGKHVILGPKEDSGIVAITDDPPGKRWGLVISHESHNKPSQVVPFEGAATGVGGCVRDVACMGARVIGSLDSLRFGDLQSAESRAIAKEVARGVAGYGNPLGIPNLGGDTYFDSGFNNQCLVNVIAVGIVREDEIIHSYVPEEAAREGYDIILVGKPTDRSGFGGAAFASLSLESDKKEQNTGAVQESNPFLERHILASSYALFDWLAAEQKLHQVSFKDLGAGGVVCATVEQVSERGFGADVDLDRVHVALEGLPAEVIACAETQERFCWMCHPSLTEHIIHHYNVDWNLPSVAENARASVIGKVTEGGIYRLHHKGQIVCEATSHDITLGLQYVRPTELGEQTRAEPLILCTGDAITLAHPNGTNYQTTIADIFKAMLVHPSYASKDVIVRHYDKTVIGNGVIEAGESDAGVLMPLRDVSAYVLTGSHPDWSLRDEQRHVGVALASDGNPRYGRISAYWQGALAAVESMMNVASVGAKPRALTDCLNYGNPEIPAHLGALEQGVRGISDAANGVAVDGSPVPIVSGNVSLYNATPKGVSVPPSAVVSCVGVLPDARTAVSMQLKRSGSTLYYLGTINDACGGSAYYEVLESMSAAGYDQLLGAQVPQPDFAHVGAMIEFVTTAIQHAQVLACHDVSDGGILLALFEMLLPQRKVSHHLGVDCNTAALSSTLRADTILFSQTPAFLLEVDPLHARTLESAASSAGLVLQPFGMVTDDGTLVCRDNATELVREPMEDLLPLWRDALAKHWEK